MSVATMVEYKHQRLDGSQAGVIERDGLKMFVSYQTIIGLQTTDPILMDEFGDAPVFTNQRFTRATSRHQNRFREVFGGTTVGQARFEEFVKQACWVADTLEAAEGV